MATREELEEAAEIRSIVVAEHDYGDGDFADFHDELPIVDNQQTANKSGSPYRKGMTRTLIEVGSTEITYGQAKLFGLLNREGKVDLSRVQGADPSGQREFQRRHVDMLSKPRAGSTEALLDEEATFKPQKTAIAIKAMRNPRCGYDFIHRLSERADILESLMRVPKKKNKEAEQEAYTLRLDKLQCPRCKRYQSFDEFTEKRRFCSICNEKYVKLNVCDPIRFERKLKKKSEERAANLARIEDEMYHYEKTPFRAKPINKALYQSMRHNSQQRAVVTSTQPTVKIKETMSSESKELSQPQTQMEATRSGNSGRRILTESLSNSVSVAVPTKVRVKVDARASTMNATSKSLPRPTSELEQKKPNSKKATIADKFRSLLEY